MFKLTVCDWMVSEEKFTINSSIVFPKSFSADWIDDLIEWHANSKSVTVPEDIPEDLCIPVPKISGSLSLTIFTIKQIILSDPISSIPIFFFYFS